MPPSIPAEKTCRQKNDGVVMTKRVPHINEVQLLLASGGSETSCYRCVVPFAVVILITGVVVTAVAYAFNSHGSNISVLGLGLLATGLGLLVSSAICWRVGVREKKEKRRESQATLVVAQCDQLE